MIQTLVSVLNLLPIILFYGLVIFILSLYVKDRFQSQHSILRTHPIIGRLRYIFEMIGPEFRQYWFLNDKEGRPVDRDTQETIAKAGKYGSTVIGFGSRKDFSKSDFYLANSMFPKNVTELHVDNEKTITTYTYEILNESLTNRKEKRHKSTMKPWHLTDEHAVVIGPNTKHPFKLKGLVGVSAMSYGALSKSAVKALAQGVAISGGSFMNTGEGGISPYHLSKLYSVGSRVCEEGTYKRMYDFVEKKGIVSNFGVYEDVIDTVLPLHHGLLNDIKNKEDVKTIQKERSNHPSFEELRIKTDAFLAEMVKEGYLTIKETPLIFQVGSGLFGARKDGVYSEEVFLENALRPEVKAIEIKMAQGAKVRGGKLPKEKITPEIAFIRGVEMGKDVESPNRFPLFSNMDELFALIKNWQELTGKPVGIKVVAGSEYSFDELASYMKRTGEGPNFISIDGGEGGTGATYQEMADTLGLPIYSGLQILDKTLKKYGVRDRVIIISSGMLATADKMAIALSFGADLIYVARAAMHSIGCISAHACQKNTCPTGITSHLPHLEKGLVVQEKRFRTANYLTTMRQGLFMLGASCGLETPTKFDLQHVTYRDKNTDTQRMDKVKKDGF